MVAMRQWYQVSKLPDRPSPVTTDCLSNDPWCDINIDFGTLPDGRRILVVSDAFSEFLIAKVLQPTMFKHTKKVL
ncbi:hypothetical protein NDU88_003289 [Pleurodeles waltl]|uniref:Uncharacterized protein n=1 Tax=Pleurodeles waltl TaxID=8319 RepID=A0AAV7UCC7_PLEWA|nr:hypothetical protein NDU88_003289 [Pleurodeles waltl]